MRIPLPEGVELAETGPGEARGRLSASFGIRGNERVRVRFRLIAAQRGAYAIGAARIRTGDWLGFFSDERDAGELAVLIAYPKPVRALMRDVPALRPLAERATRRGLLTDPTRFAGVRDYRAGDTRKDLHWKGTARLGRLQTRVFEPSTLVRGPLPGKPASPRRVPRDVVPSSVRLLVASRGAGYVLPLYVGRDRAGRLCVGTTGTWECLRSIDAQPVFSFTLQGGHGNIRDWGAIVGLAAPDVRVTVDHANREVRLPLRRFAGFQWAAFASPMWRTRAPDALHFYDRAGHELSGFIDLAFAARPCPARNQGCTPKGEWHSIGDPVGSGPSWALGERAKRIAFGDRIVRKLLAGRRYSFDTPAVWSKCGGGTIGAVLTFHIAPAKFAEDWPLSDYNTSSTTQSEMSRSSTSVSTRTEGRSSASIRPTRLPTRRIRTSTSSRSIRSVARFQAADQTAATARARAASARRCGFPTAAGGSPCRPGSRRSLRRSR